MGKQIIAIFAVVTGIAFLLARRSQQEKQEPVVSLFDGGSIFNGPIFDNLVQEQNRESESLDASGLDTSFKSLEELLNESEKSDSIYERFPRI